MIRPQNPGRELAGTRLRFVISTGRTGTVTVAQYLNRLAPGRIKATHEPWPARWEHVLGNAVRAGYSVEWLSRTTFAALRRRRLKHLAPDGVYIEVNPHLASMLDQLARQVRPLHVVHMVREPGAWVESIVGFGASGWRKRWIDHIPLARPRPMPLPVGWARMGAAERMLWRWRAINESVEALRPQAASFDHVRYEDLFATEVTRRDRALAALHRGVAIDARPNPGLLDDLGVTNARKPSDSRGMLVNRALVDEICGELAQRYGYLHD